MREIRHQFDAGEVALRDGKSSLLCLSVFRSVMIHLEASFVLMLKILSILVDLIGWSRHYNFDKVEDISFKHSFIIILDGQHNSMFRCNNRRFYFHQQLLILKDVVIEALRGSIRKIDIKPLSLIYRYHHYNDLQCYLHRLLQMNINQVISYFSVRQTQNICLLMIASTIGSCSLLLRDYLMYCQMYFITLLLTAVWLSPGMFVRIESIIYLFGMQAISQSLQKFQRSEISWQARSFQPLLTQRFMNYFFFDEVSNFQAFLQKLLKIFFSFYDFGSLYFLLDFILTSSSLRSNTTFFSTFSMKTASLDSNHLVPLLMPSIVVKGVQRNSSSKTIETMGQGQWKGFGRRLTSR